MSGGPATGVSLPERFHGARRDPSLAVLEGLHPLKHALRFGAEVVEAVSPDPEAVLALCREIASDVADEVGALLRPVDTETFERLSPSAPPSPVLALALRPPVDAAAALATPGPAPMVLLEDPTHMGNIGAVVRVAAAAGAAGVLCVRGHDPWHPAALRGGAGLQFALPVARLPELPATGRPLVAVDPEGEPLRPGALPPRALLAFGSERRGLSAELLGRATARVAIPMRPGVSSLNLATAVAVALYLGGSEPS